MRRCSIPARDLRILDPKLTYPSHHPGARARHRGQPGAHQGAKLTPPCSCVTLSLCFCTALCCIVLPSSIVVNLEHIKVHRRLAPVSLSFFLLNDVVALFIVLCCTVLSRAAIHCAVLNCTLPSYPLVQCKIHCDALSVLN